MPLQILDFKARKGWFDIRFVCRVFISKMSLTHTISRLARRKVVAFMQLVKVLDMDFVVIPTADK